MAPGGLSVQQVAPDPPAEPPDQGFTGPLPEPVAALVHQLVQSLVGHGYGGQDFAALLQMQADSAGVTLISEDVEVPDGLEPDHAGAQPD